MKTLMIAAPNSNSGKTVLTLALLRALHDRGLDVRGFKVGPDFVDRHFHESASGKPAGNLDFFLMGEEGVRQSLNWHQGEYGLVEGVMGYFDGMFDHSTNSCHEVCERLDIPAVLVWIPKGEMFSMIPKLAGMLEYSKGRIRGIILNQVSETLYPRMKTMIESNLGLTVLGYVPRDEALILEEDRLGLKWNEGSEKMEAFIEKAAEMVSRTIDLSELIRMMHPISISEMPAAKKTGKIFGIAKDAAFRFYYSENLRLLEELGEVVYFSPLSDETLPICDWYYFGGGYLDTYAYELEQNKPMRSMVKAAAEEGRRIFAESGGMLYLAENFEGHEMVGIFKGHGRRTLRLQNFGYKEIEPVVENELFLPTLKIPAQEYHKTVLEEAPEGDFQIFKPGSSASFFSGQLRNRAIGIFQHIFLFHTRLNMR